MSRIKLWSCRVKTTEKILIAKLEGICMKIEFKNMLDFDIIFLCQDLWSGGVTIAVWSDYSEMSIWVASQIYIADYTQTKILHEHKLFDLVTIRGVQNRSCLFWALSFNMYFKSTKSYLFLLPCPPGHWVWVFHINCLLWWQCQN